MMKRVVGIESSAKSKVRERPSAPGNTLAGGKGCFLSSGSQLWLPCDRRQWQVQTRSREIPEDGDRSACVRVE